MQTLELLAPAKNIVIGREAILHGADAVYIGGPEFGARQGAGNSVSDIAELVQTAHRYRARIFVALNTILNDAELEVARKLIWELFDAGVDALIVQDMGLLEIDLPPIDLHASTQCDIRSPEKARFLADVGFSQLVLARELTIQQIAEIRAAVPKDVVIEYFIHGALCVAFSGQCNISHAFTGRSANRGDCSQACRLPYTLQDAHGKVVAYEKHLLSMKDNNQSSNLESLIDAGVESFKIEGRYKDLSYVKNITGHYRRMMDQVIEKRSDLRSASSGSTRLFFTPDPDKTFHRGSTDYFATGRKEDIGAFDTPAFVGLPLGTVTKVGSDCFEVETDDTMANGDGLAYMHKRTVIGIQANTVKSVSNRLWRVFPNQPPSQLPGLRVGVALTRNRDHAWEQSLTKKSSERLIRVNGLFSETDNGFEFALRDEDGITAQTAISLDKQLASDQEMAKSRLQEQLMRFGSSSFYLNSLDIQWTQAWHVPVSIANKMRRDCVDQLEATRLSSHERRPRRKTAEPLALYPEDSLNFLANVYNQSARRFYEKHGVKLIAAAYEAHKESGMVSLMITKHCLRYSFNLCPKTAKDWDVKGVKAEPMTLVNGTEHLTLKFDCKACEMHVIGKMKDHILRRPPPSVVPMTFHKRQVTK